MNVSPSLRQSIAMTSIVIQCLSNIKVTFFAEAPFGMIPLSQEYQDIPQMGPTLMIFRKILNIWLFSQALEQDKSWTPVGLGVEMGFVICFCAARGLFFLSVLKNPFNCRLHIIVGGWVTNTLNYSWYLWIN